MVIAFVILAGLATSLGAFAEPPPQRSWIRGWNGPANHSDEPTAIITLADHSVIVAGDAYNPADAGHHAVLLKYDAQGNLQWSPIEPGFAQYRALHRLSTGDVLVIGYESIAGVWNLFIKCINPSDGSTVWRRDHPASLDFAPFNPAVAEDPSTGRLLVAASLAGDFLVLRYALKDGAFIDEFAYDGKRHGVDRATAIAPRPGGGFVVSGTQGGLSDGYLTIAADENGEIIWSDEEQGPIGNTFTPAWIKVDAQGDVLVGGGPETTCGLFQFRAWKVSAKGQRLWTRQWPTANCASAEPAAAAFGSDGSIALIGQTHNPFNIAVMRVDADGVMWTRTWNGPVQGTDGGVGVTIDVAGNVIAAGFAGATGGSDIATVGWTRGGDLLFSRTDAALPTGHDTVIALAADGPTSFVVASYAFEPAQNRNVFTSRYQRTLHPGDANADGRVDVDDLIAIVLAWGPCPAAPAPCLADIAPAGGSGAVDVDDLIAVILNFGV